MDSNIRSTFRFSAYFKGPLLAIKFLCRVYQEAAEPGSHSYAAMRNSPEIGDSDMAPTGSADAM